MHACIVVLRVDALVVYYVVVVVPDATPHLMSAYTRAFDSSRSGSLFWLVVVRLVGWLDSCVGCLAGWLDGWSDRFMLGGCGVDGVIGVL